MNYSDFVRWLPGVVIETVSVEMDREGPDFITLHIQDQLHPDIMIDSCSGKHRLVEVKGELEHLVDEPIRDTYAVASYFEGEYTTTFTMQTTKGEVSFIWVGTVSATDVEVREC